MHILSWLDDLGGAGIAVLGVECSLLLDVLSVLLVLIFSEKWAAQLLAQQFKLRVEIWVVQPLFCFLELLFLLGLLPFQSDRILSIRLVLSTHFRSHSSAFPTSRDARPPRSIPHQILRNFKMTLSCSSMECRPPMEIN